MPERVGPIGRVKLRDRVARYGWRTGEVWPGSGRYRGYGQYDLMADLSGEMEEYIAGEATSDYRGMIPGKWMVPQNGTDYELESSVHLVNDPVNAMIATPWPDASQRLDLTAFDPEGDWQEAWFDHVRDFDGNAVNCMTNAKVPLTQGTHHYTGVKSRFALPRNPVFGIRLWRALPSEKLSTENRRLLKTQITFGILTDALKQELQEDTEDIGAGCGVSIIMPYEAPIQVQFRHLYQTGNKWMNMLGETRGLRWNAVATGPFPEAVWTTLWIACFRSGIAISGDRFKDDCLYMQFPILEYAGDDPLLITESDAYRKWNGQDVDGFVHHVSAGYMNIRSNSGMWLFTFLPPMMSTAADNPKLWGPLHEPLYKLPHSSEYVPEERLLQSRTRRKDQPEGGDNGTLTSTNGRVAVTDVSGTEESKRAKEQDTDFREWMAEFVPATWAHRFERKYGATRDPALPLQKYQNIGDDPGPEAGWATFRAEVTPELYAVNIAEFPLMRTETIVADKDISTTTVSINYSASPDARGAEAVLVLDNTKAEHRELREEGAREVTIELGYELDDDTTEYTQILTGIISDPVAAEGILQIPSVGPRVPDFMTILAMATADGMLPAFDGWPVWRVFQFILRRAGFADAEMGILGNGWFEVDMTDITQGIEDTRAYTSIGPPEEALWIPDKNKSLDAFLADVAEYDYDADFWFSPTGIFTKGCRYCGRRRDGNVPPENLAHPQRHTEPEGPNSTGCREYDRARAGNEQGVDHELYLVGSELVASGLPYMGLEIQSIRVHAARGDRRRFANRIEVTAPKRTSANTLVRRRRSGQTDPITAIVDDPRGSIDDPLAPGYAHGEIFHSETFDTTLMTQADVNRRARELLARMATTTERSEPELPLNERIAKRHVFRIHGGDIGLNVRDHVYRVEYVEHDMPTPTAPSSSTRIGGVYLRTEAVA